MNRKLEVRVWVLALFALVFLDSWVTKVYLSAKESTRVAYGGVPYSNDEFLSDIEDAMS